MRPFVLQRPEESTPMESWNRKSSLHIEPWANPQPAITMWTSYRFSDVAPAVEAVEEASWVLELPENWDGEDAPVIAAETLTRATELIFHLAAISKRVFDAALSAPLVAPTGNGEIDLFWENDFRSMLINIPSTPSQITYYGEDKTGDSIRGIISSPSRLDLIAWILEIS